MEERERKARKENKEKERKVKQGIVNTALDTLITKQQILIK